MNPENNIEGAITHQHIPEHLQNMDREQLLRFHEQNFINEHKGEDIQQMLAVARGNELTTFLIPFLDERQRGMMHKLVKRVSSGDIQPDWAVFMSTIYKKEFDDADMDDYEYGDLSKDDDATEQHMLQFYVDGERVLAFYDRETGERLEVVDDTDGEIGGHMMF